eukprot:scaffold102859_cov23-Tisochrysis_lutea.AAC.1
MTCRRRSGRSTWRLRCILAARFRRVAGRPPRTRDPETHRRAQRRAGSSPGLSCCCRSSDGVKYSARRRQSRMRFRQRRPADCVAQRGYAGGPTWAPSRAPQRERGRERGRGGRARGERTRGGVETARGSCSLFSSLLPPTEKKENGAPVEKEREKIDPRTSKKRRGEIVGVDKGERSWREGERRGYIRD